MKGKLSREALKALREEGARYPRIVGYILMDRDYNAPIISASFEGHVQRLYAIWYEGESVRDLRWMREDPRRSLLKPSRKPGCWKWR